MPKIPRPSFHPGKGIILAEQQAWKQTTMTFANHFNFSLSDTSRKSIEQLKKVTMIKLGRWGPWWSSWGGGGRRRWPRLTSSTSESSPDKVHREIWKKENQWENLARLNKELIKISQVRNLVMGGRTSFYVTKRPGVSNEMLWQSRIRREESKFEKVGRRRGCRFQSSTSRSLASSTMSVITIFLNNHLISGKT